MDISNQTSCVIKKRRDIKLRRVYVREKMREVEGGKWGGKYDFISLFISVKFSRVNKNIFLIRRMHHSSGLP